MIVKQHKDIRKLSSELIKEVNLERLNTIRQNYGNNEKISGGQGLERKKRCTKGV